MNTISNPISYAVEPVSVWEALSQGSNLQVLMLTKKDEPERRKPASYLTNAI